MFSGAAYLAYKTAKIFNIPWSGLVPLILFCAPMGINQVLSGLTEPTFAFWMMASIYLFAQKKPYSAAAWLSFLPFIRSEGLVVICVVIVYMVIKKYWKTGLWTYFTNKNSDILTLFRTLMNNSNYKIYPKQKVLEINGEKKRYTVYYIK